MTFRKLLAVFALTVTAFTLVACKPKTPEDLVKNVLKDSYTGYSNSKSYQGLMFREGGDTLVFDKAERSITNSSGEKLFFSVVPEEDIPSGTKGVITSLENELEGTSNFTIITSSTQNPSIKDSSGGYQIALSDGGKTIRIFELSRSPRDYGYYDFSGQAD